MNINHERLVPGAITYWGDVVGDITDQQDLVDYISTHGGGGGGDATWGSIQGTLSNQTDLNNRLTGLDQFDLDNYNFTKDVSNSLTDHIAANDAQFSGIGQSLGNLNQLVQKAQYDAGNAIQGNIAQDARMDAIDAKNAQQDDRLTALEQNPGGVSQEQFDAHVEQNNELFNVLKGVTQDNTQRIDALENAGFATSQDLDDAQSVWGNDIQAVQDSVDGIDQRVTDLEQGSGGGGSWGSITGDIGDQQDLMYEFDKDRGRLNDLEDGTLVPTGTATETWVQNQGYVSAGASEISPLYNKSEGYLKYAPGVELMSGMTADNETVEVSDVRGTNVYTINGEVYLFKDNVSKLYKFNEDTFNFDFVCDTTGNPGVTQPYVMWADSQGRVYYYNQYKVDLTTGVFTSWSMGGDYQMHSGTVKSNLIQKDGVTYLISRDNSCAYIFNEQTQLFDSSIPITGTNPSNTFYRYLSEFDGHWIYDAGSTQTELVFHLDAAEPYLEWVTLDTRLFPGAWSYTYDGSEINETTRGVFVHPVTINGVTDYYTFGYANPVMYKLVNGAWEIVDFNIETTGFASNAAGCTLGDLLFGYGYYNGVAGVIIWNMNSNAKMSPDFYGWDNTVDSRLDTIESSLSGYATESYVQGQGYATESYVQGQGYITSSALSGYATEQWVWDRNFIENNGEGWEAAWTHDVTVDPDYAGKADNFPIFKFYDFDANPETFGEVLDNGDSLSFRGFCWDRGIQKLGLYNVDGIKEDPENAPGEITYNQTFIPFVAAEDPDTDGTYVLKATVLNGQVTYSWVPENVN